MTANPQIAPVKPAEQKETELRRLMREMGKVLVAYSGGVDSAYLAKIAAAELGPNALCVLGVSPSVSRHQHEQALEFASLHGLNLEQAETAELDDPQYAANPANRCYFCKSELYDRLSELAAARGFSFVLDGTNADDLSDHRPGRIAAGERGVRSPLAETGFTKEEIRERSRELGLETSERPASPCLSSRIAYGTPVTIGRLARVEQGEEILRSMGFSVFRVRAHDDLARLEIDSSEMDKMLDAKMFAAVAARFKSLGFRFVTLDLEGFRSGSMNGAIIKKQIKQSIDILETN